MAGLLTEDARDEVTYIGTPNGPEARLVAEAGIAFEGLPARGFDRARPFSLLVALAILGVSTLRAVSRVLHDRPDVVVGFGGYVCIPVGLAAALTRTPLVLHEQNSVPGLANRFLARWADVVAVTYPGSTAYLARAAQVVETGNPVRPAILVADRERGREALGVPQEAVVLLVFGGSRGSRHINEAVVAAREGILAVPGVHVVHITGRDEHDAVVSALGGGDTACDRYHLHDYVDDMGSVLAAADLVVSRAGATSIAEITALGRPAVLIPYPYATDDHQTLNARAVTERGGAVMIEDDRLDSDDFVGTVTTILRDAEMRATMAAASAALGRPDAARRVADVITAAAVGESVDGTGILTEEERA